MPRTIHMAHIEKKLFALSILLTGLSLATKAQQRISDGTVSAPISNAAVLELQSNNKGLLLPRLALTNTTTWSLTGTQVAGMTVYDTATAITSTNPAYPVLPGGKGIYFWDGSGWVGAAAVTPQAWNLTGNSGTNTGTNFLGTRDNAALKFKVNNTLGGFIDSMDNGNTSLGKSAGAANAGKAGIGGQRLWNTYLGDHAGSLDTGTGNTFIGATSGNANTGGTGNAVLGTQALLSNTTGNYNTAIGTQALPFNTTGQGNIAIGLGAMFMNTSGNWNIAIGTNASGANNLKNQSHNILIGQGADLTVNSDSTVTNAIAIGMNSKVGQSNSMAIGGTGTDAMNVGIGNSSPASTLQVAGSLSLALRVITASTILTDKDYSIVVNTVDSVLLTLPAANTCPGRVYRIVDYYGQNNYTYVSFSIPVKTHSFQYDPSTSNWVEIFQSTDFWTLAASLTTGGTTGNINSLSIQSDGTNWYTIGL